MITLAFGFLSGPRGVLEMVAQKAIEYKRSVDAGVHNLKDVIAARAQHCPNVKLVLAGYSQGAHVVRDTLQKLSPSLLSHIGAVALFGDPHFDPHSKAGVSGGTFSSSHHGLLGLPRHDFPRVVIGHVATYCLRHDIVCQGIGGTKAHSRYAPIYTNNAASTVANWLGLRRTRSCAPANSVSAIIDDSGSMEWNDPLNIRISAMQLLITEPGGAGRTLGAVEFGDEAGPLFAPALISSARAAMLGSLPALADDGYQGTGSDTNYNAAFAASNASQPGADARIFLTDGEHNVGPYEDGHRGGPRTYVIGLNIGPAGEGNEAADLLGRIASETGGSYYPLKQSPDDEPDVQIQRLQPVFNAINSQLECQIAPTQSVQTLSQAGASAQPVSSKYYGNPGVQAVISWTTPGAEVGVVGASARNPNGGVVATLNGQAPKSKHHHPNRHIEALQTSTVSGSTFKTVTIARPKHGSTISVRVAATQLAEPTVVTIQLSPVETLPSAQPETVVAPPSGSTPGSPSPTPTPPPPPPNTWTEQESPNHPVNTFQNYHNASGMGPAIAAGQWVQVSCRVYDPTITSVYPDGWWYRIASSPWNNAYYSPANTFMNGDPIGGPYSHNTDFAVAVC